ncbi:MAG: hypothetical protein DRP09_10555 [Candidatus Thorarchaeota archaeon]|nr:MAG: hypothetical protein DRP09_10555 [Candidatus Thorarchaeota archaeon]
MSEEDSFMDIVRERLAGHDFLEAQGKPGLFFNKFLVDGMTFYVDMRKKPMRLYGYKRINGDRDVALEKEYVDNMLQDVRRSLISIGCDLKQHGFEELPEPKKKEEPERITMDVTDLLTEEQKEEMRKNLRLYGTAYIEVTGTEKEILGTKVLVAEDVRVISVELKAEKQKTIDEGFF